ncbi:hypothetical protein J3A83DRAFT_4107817, partial [Scleroderma citrinum]
EWAKPAICEATTKFFKLCCAKEEIIQLNVEMCHLSTSIHNKEEKVSVAITGKFNHMYELYIQDPGDGDMVDNEEDVARLQEMADFLYDITDLLSHTIILVLCCISIYMNCNIDVWVKFCCTCCMSSTNAGALSDLSM